MAELKVESLIRSLIVPLLVYPHALSIRQDDDRIYHRFIVDVDPRDVGRLVGRQGHVAAALRTVVEGAQSQEAGSKKVRLLINDHRH